MSGDKRGKMAQRGASKRERWRRRVVGVERLEDALGEEEEKCQIGTRQVHDMTTRGCGQTRGPTRCSGAGFRVSGLGLGQLTRCRR